MPRCALCSTIMIDEPRNYDQVDLDEGCEHCHEMSCNLCCVKHYFTCPMCDEHLPNESNDLVKCDRCSNLKHVNNECFWCRGDKELATYVRLLYPYHNDHVKLGKRKELAIKMKAIPMRDLYV